MQKKIILILMTLFLCVAPVSAVLTLAGDLQREYPSASTYSLTVIDDAVPLAGSIGGTYTSAYMVYAGCVILVLAALMMVRRHLDAKRRMEAMEVAASEYVDDLIR